MPHHLRPKKYPDFMEKPDKPTYESQSVTGKLFREVKDIASCSSPVSPFTREAANQYYDPCMEVDGFEDYINDAFDYKSKYDSKLGNLMDYYGIETEAEILNGNSLRNEARSWFNKGFSDSDSYSDVVYAIASAWYHVTYHCSYWGRSNERMDRAHFLRFPWCIWDKLIQIKKKALRKSSLEHHFSHGLNWD
ncbi:hypothetical protein FH972_015033 [Carpinus fangiana]|uniref:RDRP C-terminal head domain-containing protein n=1 Tax=Carpinus fangiana TaxID=176857 RepID=A0A5N6REQ9_9ROSI|nr:hypothetical protein FH972_015033 [Carpinus fangiana]